MSSQTPESGVPSLLDAKAVGGIDGWSGFSAQLRYIVAQLPRWFADADVTGFSPERDEDVDVFRTVGEMSIIDYHQVKTGAQTPSSTKVVVSGFMTRHRDLVASGKVGRLVIATPNPNEGVRGAGKALARFREIKFLGPSDPQRTATLATLREKLVGAGLVREDDLDFAIEHLDLMHDWGGLEPEHEPWGRVAGELGQLPVFHGMSVVELAHAAKELAQAVEQRKRHHWTREEVVDLVRGAIARWRAGPPRANGDVILLCHQSLSPVRTHPDQAALPTLLRDARAVRHCVDHADLMGKQDWTTLPASIRKVFDPAGQFQQALAKGRLSPVVYYGFPHIPLAALAGFLFTDQAVVHLIDHDRDALRLAWGASDAAVPDLRVSVHGEAQRGAVVARISISAKVAPELCVRCRNDEVAMEIDFQIDGPMRGLVLTEEQARSYGKAIRQTLDRTIGGNPNVTSLHVFAAVPVSIAFLIGQMASSTGYPETWVYNFRLLDVPPYRWALCLQAAHTGNGIAFLGEIPSLRHM